MSKSSFTDLTEDSTDIEDTQFGRDISDIELAFSLKRDFDDAFKKLKEITESFLNPKKKFDEMRQSRKYQNFPSYKDDKEYIEQYNYLMSKLETRVAFGAIESGMLAVMKNKKYEESQVKQVEELINKLSKHKKLFQDKDKEIQKLSKTSKKDDEKSKLPTKPESEDKSEFQTKPKRSKSVFSRLGTRLS